jgi:thiaminase/transcriptional activator TenA
MSNWYETINNKTEVILDLIKDHPFIVKLMDGSLPLDIFHFYINQDALYLSEYKNVLAILGSKCQDENDTQFFLDSATGIIHVENVLHQNFLKNKNLNNDLSPTCELYTSYLSRIVNTKSIEEGIAAVLPCFTIYKEVGDYIKENQTNRKDNPFQNWINTYGGEDFAKSVKNAIHIANLHAENANENTLNKMNVAFEKASKLEWMFWDSAYKKEKWSI